MPSKPAEHVKAVTWRLDRSLLVAVQIAAARRSEPVVTFVTRALGQAVARDELDRVQQESSGD